MYEREDIFIASESKKSWSWNITCCMKSQTYIFLSNSISKEYASNLHHLTGNVHKEYDTLSNACIVFVRDACSVSKYSVALI